MSTTMNRGEIESTDPVIDVYRQLLRTARRLRKEARAVFDSYELTWAQYGILARIPPEGITLTQLAQLAWVDPGNTSGIVDRLVREGWVVRRRSEVDRRVVTITLSERGAQVLSDIEPRYHSAIRRLMSGLSAHETAELGRLLDKLAQLPQEADTT